MLNVHYHNLGKTSGSFQSFQHKDAQPHRPSANSNGINKPVFFFVTRRLPAAFLRCQCWVTNRRNQVAYRPLWSTGRSVYAFLESSACHNSDIMFQRAYVHVSLFLVLLCWPVWPCILRSSIMHIKIYYIQFPFSLLLLLTIFSKRNGKHFLDYRLQLFHTDTEFFL